MNVSQEKLREYARLLVEMGVNVQKGQDLVLSCPVDCAWFARMCAEAAYDVGCHEVIMRWGDERLSRMKYLRAADDVFDTFPQWQADCVTGYAKKGAAFLSIDASDPESFKDVDPDRLVRSGRSSEKPMEEYRHLQMSNTVAWSIGAVPIPKWAEKAFPGCDEPEAMDKLWEAIFQAVRISGDGKAVDRWREHVDTLQRRVEKLNELDILKLHYTNSLGTDLTIRLPDDRVWAGGRSLTTGGRPFIANMPTEEIFTAPRLDGVDGVVYASLPLAYNGNIIDKFHMVVKDGKIAEVHAETGEEFLKSAISLDEGASRFGEVALVPYDSPISNQKLLYYNTLFDENASCHLAFGEAYPECVKGGENMSKEQLREHGLNYSMTHVDFMLGTADLNITGTTRDGQEVQIFSDGNFTF